MNPEQELKEVEEKEVEEKEVEEKDDSVRPPEMNVLDSFVSSIINEKVSVFEKELKQYLNDLGYDAKIKVQVAFGAKE